MQNNKVQQSLQVLSERIEFLLKCNMEDEALEQINDFLKFYPDSAQALILRGKIFLRKNLEDEAICDLNQSIQLNSFIEESFYLRSTWFMKQNMWKEAHNDCNYALKLNPNYALAYVGLAKLMLEQDKNYDGFLSLQRAIELDNKCLQALFALGDIYCRIGDFELALKYVNQVIEIDNTFVDYYVFEEILNWKMGENNSKAIDFDYTLEFIPQKFNTYFFKSYLNLSLGNYQNSIIDLTTAIELYPNSHFTYFQRGVVQIRILKLEQEINKIFNNQKVDQKSLIDKKNKLKEIIQRDFQFIKQAIQDFNTALELNPKFVPANDCGKILSGMIKEDEKAFKDFRRYFQHKFNIFDIIIGQDSNQSEEDIDIDFFRVLAKKILDFTQRQTKKKEIYSLDWLLKYFAKQSADETRVKQNSKLRELGKKIEQDPNSSITYLNIGNLYKKQGAYEMALKNLNKAIELDPQLLLAYLKRAKLFYQTKLYYQALEDYQEIFKIIQQDQAKQYNQNQLDSFFKSKSKIEFLKNIQHRMTQINLAFKMSNQQNLTEQIQKFENLLQFLQQQVKQLLIQFSKGNNNQDNQQSIKINQQQYENIDNEKIKDEDSNTKIHNQVINNPISQLEETSTINYQSQLQRTLYQNSKIQLDRTIFYILKNYPDVFTFNEQELDSNCIQNKDKKQLVLENGLVLGEGSSGQVYYTINPKTNQPAALKVQSQCTLDDIIRQTVEFQLQFLIKHKCPETIIGIQGKIIIKQFELDNYKMYAYLDPGLGSLKQYRDKMIKFTENQIDNIFDCILDSIIKIHSHNIAHGDIKLENIINTKEKGWVLADFGSAMPYFKTCYGKYPIQGTMGYLPKDIRKAKNNNEKLCKMNLFKKDIYAFQLVILQLIYFDENFYKLQKILDEKQLIHPKINQLYNKDLITIQSEFKKRNFIRKSLILESVPVYKYINQHYTYNEKYKQELKAYQMIIQIANDKTLNNYLFILQKIQNIQNLEKRQQQMRIAKKFKAKYFSLLSTQEIFNEIVFEQLTKLEYDLYFDIFKNKGAKMLQLMICQGYQQILKQENQSLKLQEAEILYEMDNWNDARIIINSIENEFELENDEQIVKWCLLKARLNNQWNEANEDIIYYIQNYKEPLQLLIDWKLILMDSLWIDKSKMKITPRYSNFFTLTQGDTSGAIHLDNYFPLLNLNIDKNEMSKKKEFLFQGLIEEMLLQNYDNYTIFYYFLIYCELFVYDSGYGNLNRAFIQFIEKHMQDYYFNWIAYDQYAQYLTYIQDYKLARYYFERALKIIQNDCLINQFFVYYHLLKLEFKEKQQKNWELINIIMNIIKKLPRTNLCIHLENLIYDELDQGNSSVDDMPKNNIEFIPNSTFFLEQEDIKTLTLQIEYRREFYKIQNYEKRRSIVEDLLPVIYDRSQERDSFEIDLLIAFYCMTHNKRSELSVIKLRYFERLLQTIVINLSFYPNSNQYQQLFDEVQEFKEYIYNCSQIDYEKLKQAIIMFKSYEYNERYAN